VIFEVWPEPAHRAVYLNWAAELHAELLKIDEFSIERFESLTEPGKLLSLQFWRDDACLTAWRNLHSHRAAQTAGRETMLKKPPAAHCRSHSRLRAEGAGRSAGRFRAGARLMS
jgi:heme-degrading monooxygenase HmoA